MHQVFVHLAKRVASAREALNVVIREMQKQSEHETKTLEEAAYGDEFNSELAPIQEKVVAALQEVLEALDEADARLGLAEETIKSIPDL